MFDFSLEGAGKSAHVDAAVAVDVTVNWVTTTVCLQYIQLQSKGLERVVIMIVIIKTSCIQQRLLPV